MGLLFIVSSVYSSLYHCFDVSLADISLAMALTTKIIAIHFVGLPYEILDVCVTKYLLKRYLGVKNLVFFTSLTIQLLTLDG